ncbi:MAG: ROK family protein [Phycisphaerae bacterium]|jgi:glucokinase|nr:ROK family protein [Phycisphaerae bacterium]
MTHRAPVKLLGIDIGGTKTAVLVGNSRGETLKRVEFPTRPKERPPEAIVEQCFTAGRRLMGRARIPVIGISCGGPQDSARGIIFDAPHLPGWGNVEIVRMIEEKFGLPARLENDANAGALAEWRFGAGRGTQNFIFITMGTGFGSGLILGGRLHRGATDQAGEIGHVRLRRRGPLHFGKTGSIDALCSGPGLARLCAKELRKLPPRKKGRLAPFAQGKPLDRLTGKDVAQAAIGGNEFAEDVVRRYGWMVGEAVAVMVDILNPERVALGGMAVRLRDMVLGPAREAVRAEALPKATENLEIVPAELGERIGDVAALCVAMEALEGG